MNRNKLQIVLKLSIGLAMTLYFAVSFAQITSKTEPKDEKAVIKITKEKEKKNTDFIPSEEISEDKPVDFPVDI